MNPLCVTVESGFSEENFMDHIHRPSLVKPLVWGGKLRRTEAFVEDLPRRTSSCSFSGDTLLDIQPQPLPRPPKFIEHSP